ncbi:MAG TPA: acyl carrier protein [Candidatus Enterenecus stercoripullorum]|nr:acyl carrier protein [Candidatus Enterenecus stercoripullorum]
MELQEIKERIYQFLTKLKKADGLEYDTELFKSKYITSLFALQIVQFIEREFRIKLGRKDITEANFHTINAMAELVQQRLNGGR